MKELKVLQDNWQDFLKFMKNHYPLYHLSNVFVRDIEYAIIDYFLNKGTKLSFSEAEYLAQKFAEFMAEKGIFKPIKNEYNRVWTLNYPEFKKPSVQKTGETKT
ncbi:hypothetical protein JGI1_01028 [Candidatus Thermokryptus mobilis]|uniref:Uncharacterized protein n=1 Tax=Candidatus Thermokryptus mobilis TaxID=1643428 RepID=A0A0S4N1K9_9BACT|nr:hypothetical protein [Candidatus Thermokryptus mobilis]CUU04619.1 hypothetical protein JGI1_01028 [Candidatus Thermokryptus mobilis]